MDIQLDVPAMSLHRLLLGRTRRCVFKKLIILYKLHIVLTCYTFYCLHNKIPSRNVTQLCNYLNTFIYLFMFKIVKDFESLKAVLTGLPL